MTTTTEVGREQGHQRGLRSTVGERLLAGTLIVASIILAGTFEQSQRLEASIARWAITFALDTRVRTTGDGSSLLVGLGGHRAFTLEIGAACSVVLILVPFLLVAAAMLISGRAPIWRALPAVIVGAFMLLAVNAVRLILIAALTLDRGLEGFGWAHTV